MNKLSFILPAYRVKEHILRNKKSWEEISKFVDLIWIEDTDKPELSEIIKGIGGRHYSKKNGNWGSVINFAKNNKIINTEYVAVVDPDDIVDPIELNKLINFLVGHDLYFSNYLIKDFQSGKVNKKSFMFDKYTFIHQIWFKTKLLEAMPDLPETIPFTDNLLTNYIINNSETYYNLNCTPYIYFTNFVNQSTSGGYKKLETNLNAAKKIRSFYSYSKPKNKRLKWRAYISNSDVKNQNLILMRSAFDWEPNKELRKKIIKRYKLEKPFFIPIRTLMIWSKLFVFFKK